MHRSRQRPPCLVLLNRGGDYAVTGVRLADRLPSLLVNPFFLMLREFDDQVLDCLDVCPAQIMLLMQDNSIHKQYTSLSLRFISSHSSWIMFCHSDLLRSFPMAANWSVEMPHPFTSAQYARTACIAVRETAPEGIFLQRSIVRVSP
jgi:hypothetical protein